MEIRKCTVAESKSVGEFYDRVVKFMDANNVNYTKWRYKIYPSTGYARDAARAGNLFVCIDGEKIYAAFVLSEDPEGDYSKVTWLKNLAVGEFLVLHAFAVAPDCQRQGLGKKIVEYCINYTAENYRALRVDIVPENFPAKKFYETCGFKFVGTADLGRTSTGVEQFCLYERNL
ncbi:MAG: N-acetyltransferase [Selenomonadaceae bacterium]|nr:N-acetyltransferase [Selenomonadaceae bacterium]